MVAAIRDVYIWYKYLDVKMSGQKRRPPAGLNLPANNLLSKQIMCYVLHGWCDIATAHLFFLSIAGDTFVCCHFISHAFCTATILMWFTLCKHRP